MVAAATIAAELLPPLGVPREDHVVVLWDATWADYQRVLQMRGDKSAPRITYNRGVLQIMSPSRTHESIKSSIGRLVEVYCLEAGVEFSSYGSWTIADEELGRGVEPDECYVFGDVEHPARPDLAIEVVWTSGGVDKLRAYAGLGVREVWFWQRGQITPYVLRDDEYVAAPTSDVLPGIDLVQLAAFIDGRSTSVILRAYQQALVAARSG
ncbi:MAG: Uma2 family endonuclease [Myxococcales bacterium]|nr:Uma2 family endonuclease [Myxococcales bacterium]